MFFTREYSDLYKSIIQDVIENTPITNMGESSTTRAITESIARRFAELYGSMDAYINSAFISTATGEFLDNIGDLYGVTRHESMRAYSGEDNFRFYIDPATGYTVTDLINIANANGAAISTIVISQGTTISTGDVSYTTTSPATLSNSGTYVPIIATGTGKEFNVGPGGLINNNVASNQMAIFSIARYILCTNDEAIDTGVDYESDRNYRSRIYAGRLSAANANEVSVRNAALSVPGVSDVILTKYPEGIGTYSIVVMSEYPIASTPLLNAVNEAVSQVAALGSRAIVTTPEYLAVELKVKLHFRATVEAEEQDTVKSSVRVALIDYTNNIGVGGTWVVNEVVQRVMGVSDGIMDMEQQWFRVYRYQDTMEVLPEGRGVTSSERNQLQLSEGYNMIWTNQRASSNPPQKFLMLGRHLVVC